MGPREAKASSARRNDVIDAAGRVFARLGFTAATMDEIARDADISKGGLYRHFPSKDELFLVVAIQVAEELHDALRQAGSSLHEGPALEQLQAYVAATIAFARQRDDRMRVALEWGGVESLVDPEAPSFAAYQRAVGALRELGTSALKRGQADRSVRSDVPLEHLAACLSGALQGVLQMEMRAEEVRRRLQLPAAPAVDFVNVLTQLVRAC
jgi:TetR/AcrR family fatty acid metabolism transcriptional regulator